MRFIKLIEYKNTKIYGYRVEGNEFGVLMFYKNELYSRAVADKDSFEEYSKVLDNMIEDFKLMLNKLIKDKK